MKGLTFCPTAQINKFKTIKEIHLFIRNLLVRGLFVKKQSDSGSTYTQQELEDINQLTALLGENEPEDLFDSIDLETMLPFWLMDPYRLEALL